MGASARRVAAHCRTSSNACTPVANDATGRPGLGTAIVSARKYQSACRIVGQSLHSPVVIRNADAG